MTGASPNPSPRRILLVEDEPGLVLTLCDRLTSEGYEVESAGDGDQALGRARQQRFDLIILDLMLPRRNGFEVCRALRDEGNQTPIIMLTARGHVADKVTGLRFGADDYVTKPFEMVELLARVEAQLRRAPSSSWAAGGYEFGSIRVDPRSAEVSRHGAPLEVSAREFRLLCYLIEHRGETVSREKLLNDVWGYQAMPSTRTVDVHVAWLRQKIEPNPRHPQYLLTIHDLGYKFVG
jgi:two-component system alkaline phosphatase synthesis response regulator PhoP